MNGKIRFAPSPTGYLHEGHLLSALYVWAAAKKWNLKVHLRIEDHDQGRSRQEHIQSIYEDLEWFGFRWDEQSIQSERNEIYESKLAELESRHLVYPCYCSRKQLEAENAKSATGEIIYGGKCRALVSNPERQASASNPVANSAANPAADFATDYANRPHNLRVVVPDKVIHWNDLRLGDFAENPKLQCGDFPIRDRDGQWTYQFAVCVDDTEQGITHVVRGEDILNSTARQIALMEMLGRKEPPLYLHHPLICDATGKKLSKRERAHSLRQDRDSGLSAGFMLGRLCKKAGFTPDSTPLALESAISIVCSRL